MKLDFERFPVAANGCITVILLMVIKFSYPIPDEIDDAKNKRR
jgi:hypothetical protein